MPRWKRFRRGPRDTLVVSLAEEELGLLRSLPEQLRDVLEDDTEDPARARLFPRAYLDPTAETEEAARCLRGTGGRSSCHPTRCRRGSACSTTLGWCSARASVSPRRSASSIPPT